MEEYLQNQFPWKLQTKNNYPRINDLNYIKSPGNHIEQTRRKPLKGHSLVVPYSRLRLLGVLLPFPFRLPLFLPLLLLLLPNGPVIRLLLIRQLRRLHPKGACNHPPGDGIRLLRPPLLRRTGAHPRETRRRVTRSWPGPVLVCLILAGPCYRRGRRSRR